MRWEAVVRVQDEARVSELQFTGPVFAVDTTGDQVMETGACLAMSDKQVNISIYSRSLLRQTSLASLIY